MDLFFDFFHINVFSSLICYNLFDMAENNNNSIVINSNESNQEAPKKKKKSIKGIINIVLVISLTILALVLTISDNGEEIIDNLLNCDYRFLLVSLAVLLGALFIRAFIIFCFARLYTRRYHIHQALAVDFIGTFYNAVTPGASGGQVMQAYTLKKQGIPISSAVSMLAMNSIIFQLVLIVYGILAFALKNDMIMAIGSAHLGQIGSWDIEIPIWVLTIIGFLLNVSVILLVLLMGYWKKFHQFIMGPIISLLAKMHVVRKPDKTRENLRVQVENFKVEMRRLFSNIPFTLLITVLHIVYFSTRYSIPYFIGMSLGNQSTIASFWDCILLSNYHQMITGIIPIPGSAGVSELVFRLLFVNKTATVSNSFFYIDMASLNPELLRDMRDAISDSLKDDPEKYKVYFDYFGYTVDDIRGTRLTEVARLALNTEHSAAMANSALLMWRSMTFIIPVFISGLVAAFYHGSPRRDEDLRDIPNRQTFINLQRDTYVARKEDLDTMIQTTRLTREEILKRLKNIGQIGKNRKKRSQEHKKNEKERYNRDSFDDFNIDDNDDNDEPY